ncbi:MAG: PEGA domain-containing protein [Acidobacteria bacterium]|nr:MAG: PEGA domain-containing protein [Acidobacteriota bacterium]PYV74438.1 MAG: PEGA domain-containing protein [Acidobacteriota bacterium]
MLKRIGTASLIVCLWFSTAISQSAPTSSLSTTPQQPAATNEPAAPKPAMQGFGLEDGTPVKLRTSRTISSADAHTGDTLDFEVLEDVFAKDTLVVPKGGIAWGTVTEAQPKRRMARGGKLDVNIDAVRLVDGEKVPLRAVKDVKGGGHTGAMTGAMVGTAIVFFPAAPLFLFMHGKDITIPKGAEITAYISGDTRLDQAKFQGSKTDNASVTAAIVSTTGQLDIASTPPGADIEIDGKFVGNTPSSISVAPGDHKISIKKSGFTEWTRKMSVSSGHVNINAELTAEAH